MLLAVSVRVSVSVCWSGVRERVAVTAERGWDGCMRGDGCVTADLAQHNSSCRVVSDAARQQRLQWSTARHSGSLGTFGG